MNIKGYIPNLFTMGNLFFGTIAAMFATFLQFEATAICVVIAIVFDFFDGFLARILKVSGELGKQLDSLADMVTSGVVPGIVMYGLLGDGAVIPTYEQSDIIVWTGFKIQTVQVIGLLLTIAACYRLAKFNLDTRQSDSFIGLPTPAMSLFVVFLPVIVATTEIEMVKELLTNQYVLIGITIVLSYLMNANLPLLALKFKSFGLKENIFRYVLIFSSIALILTLQYLAVPLIIIFYIILSVIQNFSISKNDV